MTRLNKQIRHFKATELLTVLVLTAVGPQLAPSTNVLAAESGPIRVHWIASNWVAFHGLARQCGERLELDGGVSTTHSHSRIWPLHAIVDRERDNVQFYTKQTRVDNFTDFDRNLEAAQFDVLVVAVQLKMVGQISLGPQYERLIAYAARLAKKQNAQLIFATYGTELDGDNRIKGRERLIEMAERVNAKVCPWWETMRLMKKLHPEVGLWDKKVGGHPSREMTYALSYAFYFTLTGKSLADATVSLKVGDWAPDDEPIVLAAAASESQMKVASNAVQFIRDDSQHPSDVWVAVGYGGRRMMSRDMRSWKITGEWAQPGSDDSNNLMGLTYADGKFVAVGGGGGGKSGGGHVLISTDGESWQDVWKAPGRINPIVYGKGLFVVGGPGKQLYVSGDAKTWTKAAVLADRRCTHFRLGAFGNDTFVITGNNGGKSPAWILATKDGKSIAPPTFDIPDIRGLAFGNGHFVVVGEGVRMVSADGIAWEDTQLPDGERPTWVIHTGSSFLCGGGKQVYRSLDGVNWSPESTRYRGTPKWTDGTNIISTNWPGKMYFSSDAGKTWQSANNLSSNGINRVVKGTRK